MTLVGDILKGAIPVYLALLTFGPANESGDIYLSAVALAAFLGHFFPIYLKFRDSGKGVATAAGCFAVVSLPAVLTALGVFTVMLLMSRRVSVGSLLTAAVLPVAIWIATDSAVMTAAAGIAAFLFLFFVGMT